jgi:hypothetical protein
MKRTKKQCIYYLKPVENRGRNQILKITLYIFFQLQTKFVGEYNKTEKKNRLKSI